MSEPKTVSVDLNVSALWVFLVFLALKLSGVIAWSWVWVFAPLWIAASIFAVAAVALFVIWRKGVQAGRTLMGYPYYPTLDLEKHLRLQIAFSERTFGPGACTKGVIDHIKKELEEIEADPTDLTEWIDVVILALDGAWRSGASAEEICHALAAKQRKNEAREWPDWRTADPDRAIEHVRTVDSAA